MRVGDSVGFITGGASGLGEAVVRMLVKGGGRAAIVDLPSSDGERLAAELGTATRFVPTDVTNSGQVEAAIAATMDCFQRIDVTVNAAGISPAHRVVSRDGQLFPLALFRQAMDVNVIGLFDVVRHTALAMSHNQPGDDGERGLIVNVASIAAFEGQSGQAAYTASKGAVAALTLQLARDLERLGVRVMCVAPGLMDTAMLAGLEESRRAVLMNVNLFPKRLGHAEEFAAMVRTMMEVRLLNGAVLRLDGAARLADH